MAYATYNVWCFSTICDQYHGVPCTVHGRNTAAAAQDARCHSSFALPAARQLHKRILQLLSTWACCPVPGMPAAKQRVASDTERPLLCPHCQDADLAQRYTKPQIDVVAAHGLGD